jgi:hypothetical protein
MLQKKMTSNYTNYQLLMNLITKKNQNNLVNVSILLYITIKLNYMFWKIGV